MAQAFDEGQVRAWLSYVYGDCEGLINIVATDNWRGQCFSTVDAAAAYVKFLEKRQPSGIYARATTVRQAPKTGRGKISDTYEFFGFWADLDISGPGHKHHVCPINGECPDVEKKGHSRNTIPLIPDVETCLELIAESGLPEPTEWIRSGGGMYPWWLLNPVRKIEMEEQLKVYALLSERWQLIINAQAQKMGYHYDQGVGDLSRVLRIPGTVNRKPGCEPVTAEWDQQLSRSELYDLPELQEVVQRLWRKQEAAKPALAPHIPKPRSPQSGERPGDAFNRSTTWPELLEADGATLDTDRGHYQEWVRPGKDRHDGISGTTGYGGSDVLKVFSSSWHPLVQNQTYDRFGYYAATRHGGDIKAATRALGQQGYGDPWQPAVQAATDWIRPEQVQDEAGQDTEQPKPALTQQPTLGTYTYTESGMADRMQARHGRHWRFVASRTRFGWLHWNGKIWETDKRGTVTNIIDGLAQESWQLAGEKEDQKEREELRKAIRPMLGNAKQLGATATFSRRPGIAIEADELDQHRNIVTCDNVMLNLDTMTTFDHDPWFLATKKLNVAYDPNATAPRWEQFLADVLPDPLMRDYLQRAIAYTLTGDANRKAIFMLHGPSHTGKSQLINALTEIFGDFAQGATEKTFRVNDSANGPTPGLHKLRGARLVTASESTEGVRLDESLIKQLTGGDAVCSRPLYGDEENWRPEFAIWLATNHLPKFSSDDNAIWRRVKPIRFGVVFGTDDRPEVYDMGRTLAREEGPGILNWILEGLKRYRDVGLTEPDQLKDEVVEYRNDSDPVAQFIKQGIEDGEIVVDKEDPECWADSKQLYARFTRWCEGEGIRYPLNVNRFGRRMSTLEFERSKDTTGTRRIWKGIRLGLTAGGWAVGVPRAS